MFLFATKYIMKGEVISILKCESKTHKFLLLYTILTQNTALIVNYIQCQIENRIGGHMFEI